MTATHHILFTFRQFDADVNPIGDDVELYCSDKQAARDRAGNMAKRNKGPCDLAYAAVGPLADKHWNDRYITTAAPSEHHARGFRFERVL